MFFIKVGVGVVCTSLPLYVRVIHASMVQIMAQTGNHESKNLQTAKMTLD